MSEAEYLALPEEKPYLEYVDGVVLQKPMPNAKHRRLSADITIALGLYARENGGGDYGPEGRVRLDTGRYRLPDTAYWVPGRPSGDDSLPALAVEVLSPSQDLSELREKCRSFRRAGVDAGWLIDPDRRTAEVFEGDDDGRMVSAEGTLESPLLPGFALELAALFAVLDA